MKIDNPNQVWSIDITDRRMKHGFMYLVAIIDWYFRYIVGFALSNTLEKTFIMSRVSGFASDERASLALDIRPGIGANQISYKGKENLT